MSVFVSRSFAGFVLIVLTMGCVFVYASRNQLRLRTVLLVLLFTFFMVVLVISTTSGSYFVDRLTLSIHSGSTTPPLLAPMLRAAYALELHPWFGVGLGMHELAIPPNSLSHHVNMVSVPFYVLATTGLTGFFAFVLVLLSATGGLTLGTFWVFAFL